MSEQMQRKRLLRLFYVLIVLVALWVFFRWGLVIVLPFLIALLLARLLEPAVTLLRKRLRLPRWAASAICTLLCFGALFGIVYLIAARVFIELGRLLQQLPEWMAGLPDVADRVTRRIQTLIVAAPVPIQDFLTNTWEKLIREGISVPQSLYTFIGDFIRGVAGAVPAMLLFLITCVLSTYFISSDYPRVARFILRQFPERWREKILRTKGHLTGTLGKWLKAQALLMLITFLILCLGFSLLSVQTPLLAAALVALIDALPVIGLGLVLVPWALGLLLLGSTTQAFGMMALFLVCTLTRSFSEPKLVGRQIGLHPIVTLVCMYVGFQLLGILGIILAPLVAITLKQLQEWGYIRLWK